MRISFRAVSRVLRLLAEGCGLKNAPWPPTVITWVTRLAIVRFDAARLLRGLPLSAAPCSHGLIWMSDRSLGLGMGKMLAVGAVDAQPHALAPGALALDHVHGLGGSVADAWTGDTMAALLSRLIAPLGRPAASLQDGGGALRKAVAFLEEPGLGSPCSDDRSHAGATLRKRSDQNHPACEPFVSACGRVSGHLNQTLLACVAPPQVRPKARVMPVPRLCTWADRVLHLSPRGGAKTGST